MFFSVGHEKNVIYSKLVNNPFKENVLFKDFEKLFVKMFELKKLTEILDESGKQSNMSK